MRAKHTAHQLPAFPVYSAAFITPNELVIGGGGGQSKTGIKNKLRVYRVDSHKSIDLIDELELDKGEDAPMSMAAVPNTEQFVCGINSSEELLQKGQNQNCRVFDVKEGKISLVKTSSTLSVKEGEDDFQKVTVISPDGALIAAAGSKDLSLLRYPSLDPFASPIKLEKGEIYDIAFSQSTLVVATNIELLVYSLPSTGQSEKPKSKKSGKQKAAPLSNLELLKTVERPTLPGEDSGSNFRALRFHPNDPKTLYTVLNTIPTRTRTKSSPRRAFICRWDTETWQVTRLRKIGDRGLTCFDVSPNGDFLAFGSSDYTVGVIDSRTLSPLLTILKAHEFPPTCLRFNPTSNLLVSGSADNSIRVVTIPENLVGASWSTWIVVIVTLLILLFAFFAQQMQKGAW
ncbi:WD40 repeat-like protein [Abortiporus biennis]|nr:WD40 repeat-like protein [Abortiporus biennis]